MRYLQVFFSFLFLSSLAFGGKFYLTPGKGNGVISQRDFRMGRMHDQRANVVRGQLEVYNRVKLPALRTVRHMKFKPDPRELPQFGHVAAVKELAGKNLEEIYRRQAALAQELKEKEMATKSLSPGTGYVTAYQDSDRSIQTLRDLRSYNARTGAVADQMAAAREKLEHAYAR